METRTIVLNLRPRTTIQVVKVSQYDTGVPLSFIIYDGTSPASFESGTTCKFQMTRPSGMAVTENCTISGNVVSKSTTLDMTRESGDIEAELRFSKSSVDVGTCNFTLSVEPAAKTDDAIEADTEALMEIAQEIHADVAQNTQSAAIASASASDAQEYAASAQHNAQVATAAAQSAGVAKDTAVEAARQAGIDAQTASQSAQSVVDSAEAAQAAATVATNKASEATTAATTATSAATTATSAKDTAVNAKTAAETAQSAAETAATTATTAASTASSAATRAEQAAASLTIDDTLTQQGQAADAYKTGVEISGLKGDLSETVERTIDYSIAEHGKCINFEDGTLWPSNNYFYTGYIDISSFTSIKYKRAMTTASASAAGMAFYNSSQVYISGENIATDQTAIGYESEMRSILIPQDAKYARFSGLEDTTTYGDFSVAGVAIVDIKEQVQELKEDLNTIREILSGAEIPEKLPNWENGFFYPNTGQDFNTDNKAYLRCQTFISFSDGITRIEASEAFKIYLYAWDLNGTYIGTYRDGQFVKINESGTDVGEFDLTDYPNYKFKIHIQNRTPGQTLTPSDGDNVTAYKKSSGENIFEVGTGKQFTTIRAAVEFCKDIPNATVIVYPGVYDIAQECADIIAAHTYRGIPLQNGICLKFLAGSFVKCFLDTSTIENESFEPFYAYYNPNNWSDPMNSNYTLDGLNIHVKNTRYCVHDECAIATTPYVHRYINCHMVNENEFQNPRYPATIGGGLGKNGYIDINGGYYYSVGTPKQITITYHNSAAADAQSKIFIKDVYCDGNTGIRISTYGQSSKITPVYISGCSLGRGILYDTETDNAADNFEIIEWNNTVRSN